VDKLRRFDDQVARAEGAVVTVVLLSMVLVASLQALFFNIAERGVAWAAAALEAISWADTFLQKGTLWLAFVGASLATHADKHIAIDVLTKVTSPRTSAVMRSIAAFASGVIALVLARVFYDACLASDAAVPFDLELLTSAGPTHVCDASREALGSNARPTVLCALRSGLRGIGVPVASGAGIAQLIVPVMFIVIGLRLLGRGIGLGVSLSRGEVPLSAEAARAQAKAEEAP
jgi:TRAP-type C4-dicarboxylate transport system permease small subunit